MLQARKVRGADEEMWFGFSPKGEAIITGTLGVKWSMNMVRKWWEGGH
jgi:hypothetical protein